ncbi:6-phosphogluconate dehydrogenase [Steroidobacter denitrificans]|uniref:6-phosphogluconate dehydrogenase n=1 Tax=Steroidobacter denitrificans TaxID=465721 RepID=A0A127FAA2_STEDE|nr:decarboxylating 6-phosphogluconate dehydrogenase [Steroidobacter denitrificans]AMN46561.1 6-phosphogluconate dehydrogenase [Steroidobacter denitrificans]
MKQIGMIGLGRMGANMVRRLLRAGHDCVVHDIRAEAIAELAGEGARGATLLEDLVAQLNPPRAVWIMLPAALVGKTVTALRALLEPGDIIIDGGNSDYRDAIAQARELRRQKLHFIDAGTSGGIHGLDDGYCLMIGGDPQAVQSLTPVFTALAPAGGWLHCGPAGAGHFVKMVHNGIEYGLMAAYAEGFNLLAQADRGLAARPADAETAPLAQPENYPFTLDVAAIAELWRHGSVVRSWLLDLTAQALHENPTLAGYSGHVADSGEGRWTMRAAIDLGVPMPVLASALFERFGSQGQNVYANKLLSAMRKGFGGHGEKPVDPAAHDIRPGD